MERMLNPQGIRFEHQHLTIRRRCSICDRRLDRTAFYLTESDDAPAPGRAWLLCLTCNTEVQSELERSPVRSPLRTRVAVALVGSARAPQNRARWWQGRFWDELDDHDGNRFLIWFFMIVAFGHVIVFFAIMMLTVFQH